MNRDELIAKMKVTAAQKPTAVTVPGWGKVWVRSLTVDEVDAQDEDTNDKKDRTRLSRGAARLICDENGKRMFDPENPEDVKLLAAQPWNLVQMVLAASGKQTEEAVAGN